MTRTGPLTYHTNTIIKELYYKTIFFLKLTCRKIKTRLIYYSLLCFWSWPFRCMLMEPYTSFDHNNRVYVIYKAQDNYKKFMFKLSMTKVLSYCPLIVIFNLLY